MINKTSVHGEKLQGCIVKDISHVYITDTKEVKSLTIERNGQTIDAILMAPDNGDILKNCILYVHLVRENYDIKIIDYETK